MSILLRKIDHVLQGMATPLAIHLPSGQRLGPAHPAVTLGFHDLGALTALGTGQVGALAEGLVEGRISLDGSMRALMAAAADLVRGQGAPVQAHTQGWRRLLHRTRSLVSHTPQRDATQVQFHYDVSDDFYALWLDPRRVYSCAYYRQPAMALAQAQEAKLDHICRKLMLQPGERFLDVGAGWGGLLLWAAEHYGVDCTGITLSRNQHAHVQRLIADKGLQGRVRMALCDYRELAPAQPFDKIASVGMFEHVGRAHMGAYFGQLHRLLRPGGLVLNHGITAGGVGYDQLGAGMGNFVEKYIFPGGELLHTSEVLREMAGAGLEMLDTAQQVLALRGGSLRAAKTLRAYRLYLAGSAMGFEQGWMALHQVLAARPDGHTGGGGALPGAQSVYPFQREYIYNHQEQ